jgi:cell division protein FtsL
MFWRGIGMFAGGYPGIDIKAKPDTELVYVIATFLTAFLGVYIQKRLQEREKENQAKQSEADNEEYQRMEMEELNQAKTQDDNETPPTNTLN